MCESAACVCVTAKREEYGERKMIRDIQRNEDRLGVPGGPPNTHLPSPTGGLCWYRRVLLQGLGVKPTLAEKISISRGTELAFSPDQCSIYLPSA